jgi:hypothetical protein
MNRTIKDLTVRRFHYDPHDAANTCLKNVLLITGGGNGNIRSELHHLQPRGS